MSMFLPEGFNPTGGAGGSSSPDFGSADPQTSTDDVALMQRVLSAAAQNPNLIPESFMGYMLDWLQINKLQIPVSQVFGYQAAVRSLLRQALATSLAYVEYTSSVAITATTEATANTIVTAPSITFDGLTNTTIEFFSPAVVTPTGVTNIVLVLYQDATSLGFIGDVTSAGGVVGDPALVKKLIVPSAGSPVFSVRAYVSSGTGTVTAGPGGGGNFNPGYLLVTKVAP